MIFHSLDFAAFFVCLLGLYWCLGVRAQNYLLLGASYFFYGYVHPWFLILLASSTLVDYGLALGMHRWPARRRVLLVLSLVSNLGLLGCFKYFGFFVDNVLWVAHHLGIAASRPMLALVLPVGISFYTFQSLSYTIDVYRGRLEPRRDLVTFAAFVALFPQLVAGPIERATHLLPQIERPRRFDPDTARLGLMLLAWGYFKKLVIADNVAVVVNKTFSLSEPSFALIWVGTLGFCVQIYADFSAYSDIARGSASLLGFDLMKNFDHPYLSERPAEFWRRWHISLSTWFRDYVYIPLGGNRTSRAGLYRNLMVTFLLSGIWHGASWNFLLWGGYHGALLLLYRGVEHVAPRMMRTQWLMVPRILVFFALTNLGWLIFRETDLKQLLFDLSLRPGSDTPAQLMAAGHFLGLILVHALPLVADSLLSATGVYRRRNGAPRWVALEAATLAVLIVGMAGFYSTVPSDFIYFQF